MNAFLIAMLFPFHAIYIGVVTVEHLPDQNTTLAEIRVFQDDFHDALRNEFKQVPAISQNSQNEETLQLVASYFQKHFAVWINGEPKEGQLKSFEPINDIYQIVFELDAPPKQWQSFEMKADFLMEIYPQQTNMVQLKYATQPHHFRLTKKRQQLKIEW